MPTYLLGIRHHGYGTARRLVEALEALNPDLILLEGPAETAPLMPHVDNPELVPPVAMMGFETANPKNASFYPLAVFSPEWQTMLFAKSHSVEIRPFDLPLAHMLALHKEESDDKDDKPAEAESDNEVSGGDNAEEGRGDDATTAMGDSFDSLACLDGMADTDEWWDARVEATHSDDPLDMFLAIEEAVTALRLSSGSLTTSSRESAIREAWMRRCLREAEKDCPDGTIVVVCGAWHVPALRAKVKVKDDNDLLRGLPKVKMTEMTWVPWAFSRLSMYSGYGAGIVSPGFYQHQWDNPSDDGSLWLSHVAQVLRDNGNDISVAHVIEALNLAKSLAALRGISRPGLAEFDEAVTTVMGFGDDTLLSLVRKKLTLGTVYGSVPDDMTNVPLLADFYAQLKRLKLSLSEQDKQLTLDLRTDLHLQRSIFFNRCQLFGLDLASREEVANAAGTFKEVWTLHYSPEIAIRMVERAAYGNTLETACTSFVSAVCLASDSDIASLADLLESVMAADIPSAVDTLTECIDSLAATSSDFVDMMKAVPHLARIVRYGTVRNQDYSSVRRMLDVLFARINAGGVKACINPEVDSVDAMFDLFSPVDYSVSILDDEDITSEWLDLLSRLSSTDEVYPLILGYSSRLLYNHHSIDTSEVSRRLSVASSVGTPPLDLALFLDGFLYGSASTLLIDDDLFDAVNSWLHSLSDEDYTYVLPVLRRSFHRFSSPERRRIGEKAKSMLSSSSLSPSSRVSSSAGSSEWNVCHDSAAAVLPLIELFFGTSPSNNSQS